MKLRVEGQNITFAETELLVSGTVNGYRAEFTFSEDWDGCSKTAVFQTNGIGGTETREVLLEQDACLVPHECLIALAKLRVGVYGPGLDERDLAHEALLQLPDLSWMAINLHGTRAQVLVREAVKKPPAEDGSVVGDVVAESGGIVSHMEVLSGEAVCQEGDTVAAGDVLISGSVKLPGPKYGGGVDLGWSQVRAAGRIYARTWRTLTAQVPLEAQVKQYTGSEETCWSLTFLGVRTVFSRNSGISFPEYDKISRAWTAALPSGRELPLTLKCHSITRQIIN